MGNVSPHFFRRGDIICHIVPPHFFSYGLCLERFQNQYDVCHVLCEEFFMLDVTHSYVDIEREFGVVSLILIFL